MQIALLTLTFANSPPYPQQHLGKYTPVVVFAWIRFKSSTRHKTFFFNWILSVSVKNNSVSAGRLCGDKSEKSKPLEPLELLEQSEHFVETAKSSEGSSDFECRDEFGMLKSADQAG